MVHKPKHKVHSFRGLLGDGGEDEINLERQNVNVAYRIVKFQVVPYDPIAANSENVVKIYRESQSALTNTIDFNEDELIGVATSKYSSPTTASGDHVTRIIFDNVLFSRNIYITNVSDADSQSMNYYIELEEVPVSASTLMQIKLGTARRLIGAKMGV